MTNLDNTVNVVLHFLLGKFRSGHALIIDNFYNNVQLVRKLIENKPYCFSTSRIETENHSAKLGAEI